MKSLTNYFNKGQFITKAIGLLCLFSINVAGQMIEDIVIEESHGGTMILDIIHVNDKLIACSPGKLLEYNADGTGSPNSFNIPRDGKSYGKFAPIYFRDETWVPGAKILAYNPDAEVIYVVSSNLTIQGFRFDINGNIERIENTIIERPDVLDHIKVLHGFSILKYDAVHNRLFWVVQGKNSNQSTFQFHVREVFLGIYKIDESGELAYTIHEEVNSLDQHPEENYFNAIHDIAFLDDNDHYYLARLQRVDIYSIDDTPGQCEVEFQYEHPLTLGKIGKLLYVNGIGVLAFPYRLPFEFAEPPVDFQVKIYIMSEGPSGFSLDSCDSPDKRIYDAIYLPNRSDLIMCRNPVNDDNYGWINDQDIAVYHWNGSKFIYNTETDLINTNGFPNAEEPNTPIKMFQTHNGGGVMISKKHEVVYLYNNGNTYNFEPKYSGLNNIFYNGTVSSTNTFIVNLVNNGFERFATNLDHIESIRTAAPVYHIVHNGPHDRLFFYHTLNSYKSGLYMYNGTTTTNINGINGPTESINKPIGDCLFNPYKNQILVSVNAPAESVNGEIKCYDATTGSYVESIDLQGNGYCKEMFLAPNGKLYITSDMKQNYPDKPKIFVLRAKNYTLLNGSTGETVDMPFPSTEFDYFAASFCYNPFDDKVYATFKPQETMPIPYTTASDSRDTLILETNPQAVANGCFLTLDSEIINQDNSTFVNPGKILCRTPIDGNIDNELGYVFILSDKFTIYDCYNKVFHDPPQATYIDMTYSPLYDELYVVHPGSSANGKHFNILNLSFEGTTVITNTLTAGHPGFSGAIFMNNYDNMLYVYHKLDNEMLGDLSTRLIQIDPGNGNFIDNIVLGDSPFFSYYPEVLQKSQTPAINPYSNKMYIPNGAHSTVSIVGFTPNEALYMQPGFNWMSVPRYTRDDPFPEWEAISSVFDVGNFTNGYNDLDLDYLHVDLSGEDLYRAEYDGPSQAWIYIPNIDDCKRAFSTRGYVLDLFQPGTGNILMMQGEVESLNTSTELYCLEENWIGYYIYEEQNVFDALANVEEHLYHIKHQDYECWRHNYPIPSSCRERATTDVSPGTWICNGRPVIRYGEMVKVKPVIDIVDFVWNYTGSPPFDFNRPEVVYYEYEETADYTTIVIELDTTSNNPQEIGAFVNDTCVGACSVMEEDSVVVLSAYLGNNPGDSVVFEEYYGQFKQSANRITEYVVMDQQKLTRQKRAIKTGENQDVYIISFMPYGGKDIEPQDNLSVHIYPNPASGKVFIEYEITAVSAINIEIFDCLGRKIDLLSSKFQHPGKYQVTWHGPQNSGILSQNGLYLIKVSNPNNTEIRKVILH